LFHICPSALIKRMFSIVYGSGPLTPEFELRLGIVNSASCGRVGYLVHNPVAVPQSVSQSA